MSMAIFSWLMANENEAIISFSLAVISAWQYVNEMAVFGVMSVIVALNG
jgi:hypothetical protein